MGQEIDVTGSPESVLQTNPPALKGAAEFGVEFGSIGARAAVQSLGQMQEQLDRGLGLHNEAKNTGVSDPSAAVPTASPDAPTPPTMLKKPMEPRDLQLKTPEKGPSPSKMTPDGELKDKVNGTNPLPETPRRPHPEVKRDPEVKRHTTVKPPEVKSPPPGGHRGGGGSPHVGGEAPPVRRNNQQ